MNTPEQTVLFTDFNDVSVTIENSPIPSRGDAVRLPWYRDLVFKVTGVVWRLDIKGHSHVTVILGEQEYSPEGMS